MHRGERDGECANFSAIHDNVLARDANLPWGTTGARSTGLHHIVQRGRLTDGRDSHFARSTIAIARANRNCHPNASIVIVGRRGGAGGWSRGCRLAGRYFVHAVRLAPDSA